MSMGVDAAEKWALITGAGSGMGNATARKFLESEWGVLALDVQEAPLLALRAEFGEAVVPAVVDIVDRTAIDEAIDSSGVAGRLHAAMNVAGIFPPTSLDSWTEELYHRTFAVNVLGTLHVMAEVIRRFRESGVKGSIVNWVSPDAYVPKTGQLLYAASKNAVASLVRTVAASVAAEDILVNGLAPGWINTPGNEATGRMVGAAARIPLGRIGEPAELAEWAFALAERAPLGYMTGETIRVAGGIDGS